MIDEDCEFYCPYCGMPLSLQVDCSGGVCQDFAYECDVCSYPIKIHVRLDRQGGVKAFSAIQEQEMV